MANEEYINSINKWRQEVDANLRRENGWLALAGLFWLRKGTNLIGSDPDSDILLPKRAPAKIGTFEFDGNNVTLNGSSTRMPSRSTSPARPPRGPRARPRSQGPR